jgi:hypothetical protein
MTLDDLIRETASQGGFRLNVWPTDDGYQANFSRDGNSWSVQTRPDVIEAIRAAIEPRPTSPAIPVQPTGGSIFD